MDDDGLGPQGTSRDRPVSDHGAHVPVKASATVLIVRPASADVSDAERVGSRRPSALEVLLLRRNDRSGFVAGVHLYPGGAVDDSDAHIPTSGADHPESVAELEAIDRLAIAAVARESFEEAGILLAHGPDGTWATDEHVRMLRAEEPFSDALRRLQLTIPLHRFAPWGRWVTPIGAPRRYDTRFFIVEAPPDAVIRVDGREIVHGAWWDPAAALAAEREGEVRLVTPTRKTLERLVGDGWQPRR